jgi:uncharacterized protein YqfB (UPF0267 family)
MRTNLSLILCSTLLTGICGCAGSGSTPATTQTAATQAAAAPQPSIATPSPIEQAVTPPATRPSVATLRFTASSIDAILAGSKTSTTRKGIREFPGNVAIGTDGKRNVNLVILSTATKKLSELSAADAESDGSASADDLKAALQKSYPGIADDEVLTVVTFHVAR